MIKLKCTERLGQPSKNNVFSTNFRYRHGCRNFMVLLFTCVILLIQNDPVDSISLSLSDIPDIIDFTRDVVKDILKAWDIVGPSIPDDKILPQVLKSKEKKVINKMVGLNNAINRAEQNIIGSSANMIGNLQYDIPKTIRIELQLDDLLKKTSEIEAADHSFQDYFKSGFKKSKKGNKTEVANSEENELQYERHTLEDFATYVVSHNPNSVLGLMEQIHYLVSPETWQQSLLTNEGGILNQIRIALMESETNLCNVQQSPQQVIYNIYTSLQMTQLKGYTMMQFSWMLLRLYNKGNFTLEANTSREKYLHRIQLQVKAAKKAMEESSQAMSRCDPHKLVEDENYTQLTKLLQGYIQNEVDLNSEASCSENCGYYLVAKQYGCFKDKFCSQQKGCKGRIVDCRYIDSDMTVCQAEKSSDIRYKWIRYENGETLGDINQSCPRETKVDSWWRYLFWHCSYCFCLCDDPFYSDRYFNLRSVTSDVDNNKVITAIRLIKHDHIIHIQIQEGVLLPKGVIDDSTVTWKPVEEYKMGVTAEKNKDYFEMSYEERGVDLDDLYAPPNFVMTGIKFRKLGSHLNLEIRITPFNFSDGSLIKPHDKSEWISNDNTDGASSSPRTELKLNQPHIPTKHPKGNRPDSLNDQFLLFTNSDMKKDAAQHTVPFIDSQIVGPQPPTPLAGAGIFHKGLSGSGGFISPKVFTYNMGYHLQEDFDEPKEPSLKISEW